MLPAIVIGIGGTGKWVVTDLKKAIMEANKGMIPENIVLLAFDLSGLESPAVERLTFEHGKKKQFSLDFEKGPEFLNFGGMWAMPIFDIAKGKGKEWPYIYQWLKEDDAGSYNLSPEDIHSVHGAGQRRQTSRSSLFMAVPQIYQRIRDAVFQVGGRLPLGKEGKPTQRMQIFVVNSLAGGTGCGTFADFLYLIHAAILERGREQTPANISAFFVIPRGFEAVASEGSEVDMGSMEKNCYAAFRELERHLFNENLKLTYGDNLQNVNTGGLRIIDLSYFIDGTRVGGEPGSKVKHYLGATPAMADFIFLHLMEETSPQTENPNIIRHVGDQLGKNKKNPAQAPIYSTFGIYRYIFDVNDLIQAFTHKLASEVLGHFLAPSPKGESEIKSEVQDFLGSSKNTPFNRNLVKYLLEHPGSVRPTRDILFKYLEFGIKGEDIPLPVLKFDDIKTRVPIISHVPFENLEREATRRIEGNLGNETNVVTLKSVEKSYYGVLNHYFNLHKHKFIAFLKEEVLALFEDDARKGSLDHIKKFLLGLSSGYAAFLVEINRLYDVLNIPEKIRRSNQNLADLKTRNKQKAYLAELKKSAEYRQFDLVMKYVVEIASSHENACSDFSQQLETWITTFRDGKKFVDDSHRQHQEVRLDNRSLKVRGYATRPEDETEQALYKLIFAQTISDDLLKRELYEKLPHPDFLSITKAFQWRFEEVEEVIEAERKKREVLCCLLPAEFSPWEELRSKPIEWNYVFINNFLKLGQFEDLQKISLMDILAFQGKDPKQVASDLELMSQPLADFSAAEQQKGEVGEGGERVASDGDQAFAEWNVSSPGQSFADTLASRFKNRPSYHDRHQIIRCKTKHFIKAKGFPNLTKTEESYQKHYQLIVQKNLKLTPLHNFLAEKHAIRYETKLETILKEQFKYLNPRVVNLLEDEGMVKAFTLAWVFGLIAKEYREGKFDYYYDFVSDGKTKKVSLGDNMVSIVEHLVFSDDLIVKQAKDHLRQKVSVQDEEKASDPNGYNEELKTKFYALEVSQDESFENDLIRVMKIILWEHANVFAKEKK